MPFDSFYLRGSARALPLALLAATAFLPALGACGGASEGAPPAASPTAASASASASVEEGMGASLVPGADPLCGDKWKWDGTRCVELAASDDPSSTTSTTGATTGAPLPKDDAARAAATGNDHGRLAVQDVRVGDGAEAKLGSLVKIHYVGTLDDGSEFDSSRKRGVPFEFRLGGGQVIRGFERAVTGMKVGGVRKVVIPPELGYGRKGAPPIIPPNATLHFEIELLDAS